MEIKSKVVNRTVMFFRPDVPSDVEQINYTERILPHCQEEDIFYTDFCREYKARFIDTVLDIGSHIGTFALQVANHFPVTLYGAEAERDAWLLSRCSWGQVSESNPGTAQFHNIAITGKSGQVQLTKFKVNGLANRIGDIYGEREEEGEVVTVQAKSLEDWLRILGHREYDFVKINCEGAEFEIIRESSEACLRKIKYFIGEVHQQFSPDPNASQDMYEKLRSCGFEATPMGEAYFRARRIDR